MKVVANTNILVSGFLWDGLPACLLDAGLAGRLSLYNYNDLLDELDKTLHNPKFSGRLTSHDHGS
jgi:putative PIN family toxin of toxin-antitoxin system